MEGLALINEIIRASGLPEAWAQRRFESLLLDAGLTPTTAKLSDIRSVLADLLQEALVLTKEELAQN